jgi:hypothetical protein
VRARRHARHLPGWHGGGARHWPARLRAARAERRLELDSVTLRRTAAGRLALSFPERKDCSGRRHPLVPPLSDGARVDLEAQVFELLASPSK